MIRNARVWGVMLVVLSARTFSQSPYNQFYLAENLQSKELIKGVARDASGYLWVATDDGLLRYDGYETNLFYNELPSPFTKALLKKRDGRLLILDDYGLSELSEKKGAVHIQPVEVKGKPFTARMDYPKELFEDRLGDVWVGEVRSLSCFTKDTVYRFDMGDAYRSISYHRTFSFAEDAFGNLWIAPWKGSLLYYNRQENRIEKAPLHNSITQVSGIVCAKGDYLLLGGLEGILKVEVDSNHKVLEEEMMTLTGDVSTLCAIDGQDIYVGTASHGLYYFSFDRPALTFSRMNVPFSDIVNLYYDAPTTDLWIAGSENVGLLKKGLVTTLPGVGQLRVESLTMDAKGGLYFSTGSDILYLESPQAPTARRVLTTTDTYFNRLLVDGDRLWIGDAFGRLSYVNLKTGARVDYRDPIQEPTAFLYEDRSGREWLTGRQHGLVAMQDGKEKQYPYLPNSVVVRESPDGSLYCGGTGKALFLAAYDAPRDTFRLADLTFGFDCPDDITLNDLAFQGPDTLWLATNHGLLRRVGREPARPVERITLPELNPAEPIRALAVTGPYVCFASTQGLVISKGSEYILFNQSTGFPSKLIKERGIIVDAAGNLWISTAKGVAVVHRQEIHLERTTAPIIKSLRVNDRDVDVSDAGAHTFRSGAKLEAVFGSLTFPAASVAYQTRIVGLSDGWSTASSNRNLNVLGFSYGNYTIEVRARDTGKLWSVPCRMAISILPPWYRTWVGYLIFIIGGLLILALAVRVFNRRLIRQRQQLKEITSRQVTEIHRQKSENIQQQEKLIQQKEELIAKNEAVYQSQQRLLEADRKYLLLKEKHLQDEIAYKNKQITTHTLNILQKNETLRQLLGQLKEVVKNVNKVSVLDLRKTIRSIEDSFKLDKDWDDFRLYFEQVHTDFYSKLKVNYPELTSQELRHCALIRLNLTLAECASIFGISEESVKVSRTRIRKKLGLNANQSLSEFILAF